MATGEMGEMLEMDFGDSMPSRGGGSYLKVEGDCHNEIVSVEVNPVGKNGAMIPNALFKVNFNVLSCSNPLGNGTQSNIMLFRPSIDDTKEQQQRTQSQLFYFFVAIGLQNENDKRLKINLSMLPQVAVGRQFINRMRFKRDTVTKQPDPTKLQQFFADFWHIDDPSAPSFPRDEAAIASYPAEFRRKPESFAKEIKSTTKPNSTTTGKPPAMPSNDPLDDL